MSHGILNFRVKYLQVSLRERGSFTFGRYFQALSVNGKSRNHRLSPSTRSAWFISMMPGVNVGEDCMKKKGLPFGSPLPLTMLWH
jgi:hypothetical protein